jgi:succinate dehydrogenase / fumarate reductase, cytochrome b subunit
VETTKTSSRQSWWDRNYFLLRRLHSLTGIVPIGVFLIAHLTTNSSILWGSFALRGHGVPGGESQDGAAGASGLLAGGAYYFWKEVKWINEQIPHLLLIEIVLWSAIAFHSILGVIYATTGKSNTTRYAYQDNWRYSLQRITGYIGIFYIFYHVATLRWGWDFLVPGGTKWDYEYSASTLAAALRGGYDDMTILGFVVSAFYMLGVTALVFHFANGLWTAAITWGLTVSARAQKQWGRVCFALGAGLMLLGWGSVIGFAISDPEHIKQLETKWKEVGH